MANAIMWVKFEVELSDDEVNNGITNEMMIDEINYDSYEIIEYWIDE